MQQNQFKALGIIHKAMLAGQIMFATVSVFLVQSKAVTPQLNEYDRTFQVIAILVAAAGFLIGTNLFKKQLRTARDSRASPNKKFETYRKASITLWAMLEIPCLVCIMFFLLTANYAFMALVAVLIFLFVVFGPSKQKIMIYLGLNEADIDNL